MNPHNIEPGRLAPPGAQTDPVLVVQHLLGYVLADVPADVACVCSYSSAEGTVHDIAHCVASSEITYDPDVLQRIVECCLRDPHRTTDPGLLDEAAVAGSGFLSGLLYPLQLPRESMVAVVLFATDAAALTPAHVERLAVPVSAIRAAIENLALYEQLARTLVVKESMLASSRAFAENPTPQNVVDVLRANLFDSHITSCALLLFGPMHEDRPHGPYDYLEIQGSWSARRGAAVGIGIRIYLDDYPELVEQINAKDTLAYNRVRAFSRQLDPFTRSLLRAERIVSLVLVPLRVGQRTLGVVLIGTNRPHHFTWQERQNYHEVCEFLAVAMMQRILQQQHDMVLHGRAALLDAVTDGVVMVLPAQENGRVLTVNHRFTEMFGIAEADAHGLLLKDLLKRMALPPKVYRELRDSWTSIPIRDPATLEGEFHAISHTGYQVDVEWYSAPVYQDRRVLGRIYTFHDVTAERAAVRMRSAFLSRISHELRTPLTSIQGFAQFILEVTGDDLPPLAREYTEIIHNSALHLQHVFNDIIQLSRADSGELGINLVQAHLPDAIIQAVAQLELQYKNRGQQVIMDLDDLMPPVMIDFDRMIQVITNLLTNAIKYAPEGSIIRITARPVKTLDRPYAPPDLPLPGTLITVRDEGEGLPETDIERVFQPFTRTARAAELKVEGAGLGLSVARSVIELHGGRIWAEPATPDQPGGQFCILLPGSSRNAEDSSA